MSQIVTQSVISSLIVYLTLDNVAVTGLVFSDLTCGYRKEGAGTFTAKALTALNFIEIGSGVYTVEFTAAELNTLGSFTFLLNGVLIDQAVVIATIQAAPTAGTTVAVSTCVITGHVFTLGGAAIQGAVVSAKLLALPTVLNNVGISSDVITTQTDSNGEFFLSLTRAAEVELTIPEINYKRIFVVPNEITANLFTNVV